MTFPIPNAFTPKPRLGGLPMQPATQNLHTLASYMTAVGDITYHYVDIRLFARIGAPIYRVVVANA